MSSFPAVAQFEDPDCSWNEDGVVVCQVEETGDFWFAECFDNELLQTIWDPTVWNRASADLLAIILSDEFLWSQQTPQFGLIEDLGACAPLVAGVQSIEEEAPSYTWVWVVIVALLLVLVMTWWVNRKEKNNG